jgi:DNA-binding NarL/FixJ family response regulator
VPRSQQAQRLRLDVCLFDIRMPELDGIEATRLLAGPDVDDPLAIVVTTTFDLDEYVHGALKAGARGFLLKDAGPELLLQAIHAAVDGDALIAPSVTARLLAEFADDTRASTPPAQPVEPLTEREEEVLTTVAPGRTNAEIADELYISLSTVKTHLASLMTKLGSRNRVEIAMWAYETGRLDGRRREPPEAPVCDDRSRAQGSLRRGRNRSSGRRAGVGRTRARPAPRPVRVLGRVGAHDLARHDQQGRAAPPAPGLPRAPCL